MSSSRGCVAGVMGGADCAALPLPPVSAHTLGASGQSNQCHGTALNQAGSELLVDETVSAAAGVMVGLIASESPEDDWGLCDGADSDSRAHGLLRGLICAPAESVFVDDTAWIQHTLSQLPIPLTPAPLSHVHTQLRRQRNE
jgi:hypothetical protein